VSRHGHDCAGAVRAQHVAVGAGLRPLRRIERTAAAIAGGDLSQRIPPLAPSSTEVGRLGVALNRMLLQIEQAFSVREESETRMRRFVADVSHELRTPLFAIKGLSELYRMGGLSSTADVDGTMTRIESEAARLVRLTEDLLLLAQLDEREGLAPLELEPMDLRSLAADAHHDLRALDPTRSVKLSGPDGRPPRSAPVLGDEKCLRRVVANLVGNVISHTPAGTPVRIGVGTGGTRAILEVEDQGPGMTAEQAHRVFDRFYRVEGSRSRASGAGAGLGLAIVESLVRAHGGQVELLTAPGAGATFRIVLPAAE
jgi:two-component system OmpR family sensor kinase